MTIMILAISLLLNIILAYVLWELNKAWEKDIDNLLKKHSECNSAWGDKYSKLLEEYKKAISMEDDCK